MFCLIQRLPIHRPESGVLDRNFAILQTTTILICATDPNVVNLVSFIIIAKLQTACGALYCSLLNETITSLTLTCHSFLRAGYPREAGYRHEGHWPHREPWTGHSGPR